MAEKQQEALMLESILGLLGTSDEDDEFCRFVVDAHLELDEETASAPYWENPSLGLSLLSEDGHISTAHLFAEGREGFAQYPAELPGGVTFTSTREDVRGAFGPADKSGTSPGGGLEGRDGDWDLYEFDDHSVHFLFHRENGVVDLVTLMIFSKSPTRGDV